MKIQHKKFQVLLPPFVVSFLKCARLENWVQKGIISTELTPKNNHTLQFLCSNFFPRAIRDFRKRPSLNAVLKAVGFRTGFNEGDFVNPGSVSLIQQYSYIAGLARLFLSLYLSLEFGPFHVTFHRLKLLLPCYSHITSFQLICRLPLSSV